MDRYRMCQACPNRLTADLFEALGEPAKASAIREGGCSKWKDNLQTFHPTGGFGADTYAGCIDDWIPRALIVVWHAACHAGRAFNDARNLIETAGGLPSVVSELVGLGMVTVAGSALKQQLEPGEETPGPRVPTT